MQRVSKLSTAVISTPDEHGRLHVWRAIGFEALPKKVRYVSDLQSTFQSVLESGEPRVLRYEDPAEDGETSMVLVVLPLRIQNRTIGVLEAYGQEEVLDEDTVEILSGLAGQAASALENARLYEALAKRERQLEELVGKLLSAQEEERRKVAYEVHDGLAQVAVAAHQRLQTYARRHPPVSEGGKKDLERILKLVQKTVGDSRRIIADLRPTALDDFGLGAALRQEVEELRDDGWQVEYEEAIGDERLPAPVEVALFRVAQEAMTNARKHAQTGRVRLVLGRRQGAVDLEVRDWGRGFDPEALGETNGPGERIGLSGMRERIGLVGGKLEVHSRPGEGTSITARVPLSPFEENGQEERAEL
jgi:signal transduction histidine kinase